MKMKNEEMFQMVNVLSQITEEKGKLGYAIVRNLRKISDCCKEYSDFRVEKMREYGNEEEVDGGTMITISKENEKAFVACVSELGEIEHEVDIFKVSVEEFFSGNLTSRQMDMLWWMIDNEVEEKKDENEKGSEQTEV